VLLAHHADDQAESVLLALSRGAGLAGLAGMAPEFERGGVRFARPLLEVPGPELKALAQECSLGFTEDPTNTDERYTRNKFRSQLMPAVAATMPAFRDTFARSARHAAQAHALLETVAQEDYQRILSDHAISLQSMINELPPLRWPNVLRYWLKLVYQVTPSAAQLDELCAQIATSQRHGAPRKLRLKVANGFVQREGDLLRYISNYGGTPE
jgi:tRNA(Ile)-lysidine synthase